MPRKGNKSPKPKTAAIAKKRTPAAVHSEHNRPHTPEKIQCRCVDCQQHRADLDAAAAARAQITTMPPPPAA